MKISKLRRTLAVFLSALMLTLCAPMSAFTITASAEAQTYNLSDILDGTVTKVYIGDIINKDATDYFINGTYCASAAAYICFVEQGYTGSGSSDWISGSDKAACSTFSAIGDTITIPASGKSCSYETRNCSANEYWTVKAVEAYNRFGSYCPAVLFESDIGTGNTEISTINIDVDMTKIPAINVGDEVPGMTGSFTGGSGASGDTVKVSTENVSYRYGWAIYDVNNDLWCPIVDATFESGAKYGIIVMCTLGDGYSFSSNVELTGNIKDKCTVYFENSSEKQYVVELGTIDEINTLSGNGGSSTGNTITLDPNYDGSVTSTVKASDEGKLTAEQLSEIGRPEYTFIGWFSKPEGGNKIDENTILNDGDTIYAQWINTSEKVQKINAISLEKKEDGTKGTYVFKGYDLSNAEIESGYKYYYKIITFGSNIDTLEKAQKAVNDDISMMTERDIINMSENPEQLNLIELTDGKEITVNSLSAVCIYKINTNLPDVNIEGNYHPLAYTAIAVEGESAGNTITLDPNYDNEATSTVIADENGYLTDAQLAAPTRTGYTFGGWYTEAIKGTKVTTSTPLADGATIYAQWYDDEVSRTKPVSFLETVQLIDVSGDDSETKFEFSGIPELSKAEIDAGFKYVYAMAPNPTAVEAAASKNQNFNGGGCNRNDYSIDAIYTNDITDNLQIELDTLSIVCFMKVNTNKTFNGKYHIFAEKDFAAGKAAASTGNTITLNANSGTLNGDATATINEQGKLESMPAEPTYTGHAFIGWFTTQNGGTKVDTTTTLSNGDTIYAQWVDISGTIPLLNATLDPVSGNTYKFNGLTALTEDELALGYRYYYNIYTPEESDHETPESLQEAAQGDIRDTVDQSIGGVNNIFIYEDSPYVELPSSMEITIPSLSSISIQKVNLNYHYEDDSEILYMLSFNELVVEPAPAEDTIKEVTITVDTSKLPEKLIAGQTVSGVLADYVKAFTLSEGVEFENIFGFFDSDKNYTTSVVAGNDYYMYTFIKPTDTTKAFDDSVTINTIGGTTQVEIAKNNKSDIMICYYLGKAYEAETPENKAEKAASDIDLALDSLKPTNDTVKDDVQKIVDANKGDTEATVTTFELTPATEDADGSLTVTVTVSDGTNTKTVEKTYTIDKLPATPENKAEKAAEDIDTALDDLNPTNDTTKDDVQKIVDKNKGDTTATVTTFELTPATEETDGSLKVTVTVSDGTNTETVEKTYVIPALGAGNIKIEGSDKNVGGAGVENAEEAKAAVEITEEEQALIDSGYDLTIVLNVENADQTVSDNDKALTESAVEESEEEVVIGMYLDITLLKKIGSSETAVTETSAPISIAFEMPESLVNGDEFVTRQYFVIRVHDGKTEIIPCEYDPETGKATFETDKFSSYAIAYTDSEDPIPAFVERLYRYMLGRHSDPVGKANHVANLRNGETAVKVSFDFVYSDEFKNMNLSNEEIAERLYLTFLDRSPDAAGLADWTATLDGGCSVGHLFYGFTQSKEFTELCEEYGIVRGDWTVMETRDVSSKLTAFVSRLYTKALNRTYDVDGLNSHTANYIANHDLYQLAYDFIFSSEFIEKDLSDEDFVDTMYRTFFDREGDPDGRADWLGRMKSGCSREEVLAGFVGSQECADLVAKFGI